MQAWITKEDLDTIAWRVMDCTERLSEDELANLLIGIAALHESRMLQLFQAYETLVREKLILETKSNGIH